MEDSEDDTASAMAAAMGFSSFGAQGNPNKRRKFNPHADAVVDDAAQETKTGSNATPLGVRAPAWRAHHNKDEIDLDDDEEEGLDAPSSEGKPGHLKDGHGNGDDDDNSGPQYLDTSRPPTVDTVADDIQSKIDDIIGAPPLQWPGIESLPSFSTSRGGRGSRGQGQGQGHSREPEGKWWEGYYDPSFNVNPWERLEQTKGLEPRGKWMSWEEAKG
ncbi:hypothetical protein F4820DRAFT_462898 [Hypoxylon rubiginosum]|uniref:Uncharacterized protein n=1 Tax=Hypoxylon rubiginosum TaxID=110542 RepID=A0ACB9YHL1_9PEZI|nr:hypothetical protein F4820DRAFT_462898 [Hypoxylon rubiginosum]